MNRTIVDPEAGRLHRSNHGWYIGGRDYLGVKRGHALCLSGSQQPASLLTPIWVDKSNMASTVIKDKFVDTATLCGKVTAAVCQQNNIAT